ncbi:hypothetical protein C8J24_2901 [Sphingomonas aerolata]|uniref:Uncharacterized protein n=1 Tax=Sphingomonas aerolata TaxID=185951 RepID=A0A2T4YMR4_9SPHN|nr:hypothetical protein [Sphingomonas aerolata]NII58974.1 CBS domain containing-hemolysin-like protein [Sphingomonas aerolata]PTM44694.1 hypothetical protein C8J24_2901 [Sphingomonas aerolata]
MTLAQKILTLLIVSEVAFIATAFLAIQFAGLGPLSAVIAALLAIALPVAVWGDVVGLMRLGRIK